MRWFWPGAGLGTEHTRRPGGAAAQAGDTRHPTAPRPASSTGRALTDTARLGSAAAQGVGLRCTAERGGAGRGAGPVFLRATTVFGAVVLGAASAATPLACKGAPRAPAGEVGERAETRAVHSAAPLPPGADVTRDPATGAIRWLRGADLSRELESDPNFRADQAEGRAEAVARRFVEAYAGAFRLEDPVHELRLDAIGTDETGRTRVTFAQTWRGHPVLRCVVHVHLDLAGRVVVVNGDYLPTPAGVDPTPTLSADDACERAATSMGSPPGGRALCDAELVVAADREGRPRLVWRARNGPGVVQARETLVDARSGEVLESLPLSYPMTLPGERTRMPRRLPD